MDLEDVCNPAPLPVWFLFPDLLRCEDLHSPTPMSSTMYHPLWPTVPSEIMSQNKSSSLTCFFKVFSHWWEKELIPTLLATTNLFLNVLPSLFLPACNFCNWCLWHGIRHNGLQTKCLQHCSLWVLNFTQDFCLSGGCCTKERSGAAALVHTKELENIQATMKLWTLAYSVWMRATWERQGPTLSTFTTPVPFLRVRKGQR